MKVEFLGAAGTVTGSMHLVRTGRANVLLDCGLFQGRRMESFERNRHLPLATREVDAVVLSHAHIDHSGALPLLVRAGYGGTVFATPATRDLCAVMLEDAARIQVSDARVVNRLVDRGELDSEHVEPLFEEDDVLQLLAQMVSVPYHRPIAIADGVRLTFLDAGHVLGSAIVVLDVESAPGHGARRLVFSGDLGRHGTPILRDPEVPTGADALILESTYGDRLHPSRPETERTLAEVVRRTAARGGKVIVPTFALERAQELLLTLGNLRRAGAIPAVPVVVDSPLAVKVTEVFRMHPDCYDAETRQLLAERSPFDFDGLSYVSSTDDSKAVTASRDAAVILAGSGMCESGRVLHHLRACVESDRHTVMIVGYQAPHTLGRRLVERRSRVRIFGVERERRCDVAVLSGLSAHADQQDLRAFVRAASPRSTIALVHGEPPAQQALADALRDDGARAEVRVPIRGQRLDL